MTSEVLNAFKNGSKNISFYASSKEKNKEMTNHIKRKEENQKN